MVFPDSSTLSLMPTSSHGIGAATVPNKGRPLEHARLRLPEKSMRRLPVVQGGDKLGHWRAVMLAVRAE